MKPNFYNQDIILENQRVILIPFSEEFAEGLNLIINDKEITRFSGNHIYNEEDFAHYISQLKKVRQQNLGYPFLVIDKQSQQVAGTTRLANINFGCKRLEIGWTWYGKQFRGSGINEACKYELLNYVFETMQFRRVQFSVDIDNIRSQKAVIKLGAKQEGIFRHNYIHANGESRDDIYYSIIRPEWNALKKTIFSTYSGGFDEGSDKGIDA